jgi:uncharacterized protein
MISLSKLYRYPVKSCAPDALTTALVEPYGLAHDRRWMIVDAHSGKFLTGREHGKLVTLHTQLSENVLTLSAPDLPAIIVQISAQRMQVKVWDDQLSAPVACAAVNQALSVWLKQAVCLVWMDAAATRLTEPTYASAAPVSFADGYPLLLLSQAAISELNAHLPAPISLLRFRPNLVIDGCAPHAEDGWQHIQIGEAQFAVVKPCVRCVFTTVQSTGEPNPGLRDASGQPLQRLKDYRRTPKGITFGMNLIPLNPGAQITLGDAVQVLR